MKKEIQRLDDLRYDVKEMTLAQEGFSDILKKVVPESIRNFISFNKGTEWNKIQVNTNKELEAFTARFNDTNYMDFIEVTIDVPEGFDGSMLEYSRLLLDSAKFCIDIETELDKFHAYVSKLANAERNAFSLESNQYFYMEREKSRQLILTNISKLFTSDRKTKRDFVTVFKQNTEVVDTINNMISAAAIVNKIDKDRLKKKIGNTSVVLSALHDSVTSGKIENTSSTVSKEIAEGTYALASDIEFFATITHQINTLFQVMLRNKEKMK